MRACSYLVTIGLALHQQRTTEYLEHPRIGRVALKEVGSKQFGLFQLPFAERENRLLQGWLICTGRLWGTLGWLPEIHGRHINRTLEVEDNNIGPWNT